MHVPWWRTWFCYIDNVLKIIRYAHNQRATSTASAARARERTRLNNIACIGIILIRNFSICVDADSEHTTSTATALTTLNMYVYVRPPLKPRIYYSPYTAVWVLRWVDKAMQERRHVQDPSYARILTRLKYIIPTAYIPPKSAKPYYVSVTIPSALPEPSTSLRVWYLNCVAKNKQTSITCGE